MTPAIATTQLTKEYGSVRAVDELDLSVEQGTAFGFLGPNGSGKSTTIGMLLGLVQPTDGEITILGDSPLVDPVAVRSRVGVLPDGFTPYPSLTGLEHIKYIASLRDVKVNAEEALASVGLADASDRVATTYSRGMLQRLGLAIALLGDPDVLVLDEPFTGLDPEGVQLVREIVEAEREAGGTVLFSSHILGQIGTICDEIGILSRGRLVAEGSISELRTEGDLGNTVRLAVEGSLGRASEQVVDTEPVRSVASEDGNLVVEYDPNVSHLDIIRRLSERGVDVRDAEVNEPTVEDIYRTFAETE
jgi:ABC-2 type transport system ATP-binding protein